MNDTADHPAAASQTDDLLCPLCEYNLRGLIDPRCPECGHRFEWDALRLTATERHPYLFEHNPRLRAMLVTWAKSLAPRRFWQKLRTTHKPAPRRLMFYWITLTLISIALCFTPIAAPIVRSVIQVHRAREAWIATVNQNATPAQIAALKRQFGSIEDSAKTLIPYRLQLTSNLFSWSMRQGFWWSFIAAVEVLLLWPVLTFAMLMIYRGVLRQAQIRKIHVWRIAVYSAAPLIFVGPLLSVGFSDNILYNAFFFVSLGFLPTLVSLMLFVMALVLMRRVVIACRSYLGLPLLTAGAILTQIFVALVMVKLYMVVMIGWW